MLFLLAERTGYSIEYMLWQVPLSIFCQGIHAYLHFEGAKVRRRFPACGGKSDEIARLLGLDDKGD